MVWNVTGCVPGGDNYTYSAKRQDHYQHGVRGGYNQEVPSRVIGSDSQDRWDLESPRSQCCCPEDLVVSPTLSAYRRRLFELEMVSTHRTKGSYLQIHFQGFMPGKGVHAICVGEYLRECSG